MTRIDKLKLLELLEEGFTAGKITTIDAIDDRGEMTTVLGVRQPDKSVIPVARLLRTDERLLRSDEQCDCPECQKERKQKARDKGRIWN